MESQVQLDHPLVVTSNFTSVEDYVLHLMHLKAYEYASTLCRGRTVLDWGCNSGYGMSVLAATARQVGGVDTSDMCLAEVRQRYPEFADCLWLFDGINIPFSKRDWGAVVSFQVIEHVQNVNAYLSTIRAVLGAGGLALFATPNRLIRLAPGMKPWNRFHVKEFSAAELKSTLLEHFRYVQVYGLQGNEDIVNTERERSARAKRYARMHQKVSGRIAMRLQNVVARAARVTRPQAPREGFQESMLDQWTTGQLFYDADRLDDAIDLFAACSDAPLQGGAIA
jgi:cyclopropane fatty-acyl-phospholipid synthase-like methyltransferase